MATFRDVVSSSDRAFGMNLKDAWRIQKIKSLKEGIMKISDRIGGMSCNKYYVIPKDYKKVQWSAFMEGNVLLSPLYWTGMAIVRYGMATYDVLSKNDITLFSSNITLASIWMGSAVAMMYYQSQKLAKKLKNKQE